MQKCEENEKNTQKLSRNFESFRAEDIRKAFFVIYDKKTPEYERLMSQFYIAECIRRALPDMTVPDFPDRPMTIPMSDRECQNMVLASMRAGDRGGGDKAADFGEWRYKVWLAEYDCRARVTELLRAVEIYDKILIAFPHEKSIAANRQEISDCLLKNWDIDIERMYPWTEATKNRIIEKSTYHPDVMTRELGYTHDD